MKIELHGIGFEDFELPKWVKGVAVVGNEEEVGQDGKYPVLSIDGVTVIGNGLYVAVTLRSEDEHLPQLPKAEMQEVA